VAAKATWTERFKRITGRARVYGGKTVDQTFYSAISIPLFLSYTSSRHRTYMRT